MEIFVILSVHLSFHLSISSFNSQLPIVIAGYGPDWFPQPAVNFSKLETHVHIYEEFMWPDNTT